MVARRHQTNGRNRSQSRYYSQTVSFRPTTSSLADQERKNAALDANRDGEITIGTRLSPRSELLKTALRHRENFRRSRDYLHLTDSVFNDFSNGHWTDTAADFEVAESLVLFTFTDRQLY